MSFHSLIYWSQCRLDSVVNRHRLDWFEANLRVLLSWAHRMKTETRPLLRLVEFFSNVRLFSTCNWISSPNRPKREINGKITTFFNIFNEIVAKRFKFKDRSAFLSSLDEKTEIYIDFWVIYGICIWFIWSIDQCIFCSCSLVIKKINMQIP